MITQSFGLMEILMINMKGTRWRKVIKEALGQIYRECKVTVSPIPKNKQWIFIVGCYNSGTTLLSEILGAHPQISALPTEGQYLTDEFFSDHEIGLSRMWTARDDLYRLSEGSDGPDVIRLKKEWAMRFDLSKQVLLEKTPANMARMRWLQENFENSYFLGIVRNGYSVSEGICRKAKPVHRKEGWPIELAARQWAKSNEIMLEDAKYIKNFKLVTYEDLTDNPTNTVKSILDFLRLDAKEIDISQKWAIHERNETIQNLNQVSIRSLNKEKIELINTAAMAMLKRFNYEVL